MGWNMIWSQAITEIPFSFMSPKKRTIFLNTNLPVGGDKIRIRFSNSLNNTAMRVGGMVLSYQDKIIPITLKGKKEFDVPGYCKIYSDEIDVALSAKDNLQVRYYLNSRALDFNYIEETAGSFTGKSYLYSAELPEFQRSKFNKKMEIYQFINGIDAIEVWNNKQADVIAAFGDSITASSRYTKPLSQRLYDAFQDNVILINRGISGNCMNYEKIKGLGKMFGRKGVDRFSDDILSINGLKSVLFAIGTNDIPSIAKGNAEEERKNFYEAYSKCINLLKENNIYVVGSTIMPREQYKAGTASSEEESIRKEINMWIRNNKEFDYIIDWDELAKDEKHPNRCRDGFHQGDYLHPSATGGLEMANFIDLNKLMGYHK